jgi:hypothetical protein
MRLTQRIDSLKVKLNTESVDKEIVLSSSSLVTTDRRINSERLTYQIRGTIQYYIYT